MNEKLVETYKHPEPVSKVDSSGKQDDRFHGMPQPSSSKLCNYLVILIQFSKKNTKT